MRNFFTVAVFATAIAVMGSAAFAAPPTLVSPSGVVAQRCPTFSWSAVPGAAGYELVVYRVSEGVESEPLLTARLPAGAAAWTPGERCPATGGQYAWTLRVLGQGEGPGEGWADPVIFEVAAAPTLDEVQAALATLRRYLAESQSDEASAGDGEAAPAAAGSERPLPRARREPAGVAPAPARLREPAGGGTAAVSNPLTPAAAPTLGAPSLTVDANIALGAASNVFKDGSVFLWDDTTGNTALGREALASADGTAIRNTAVGRDALRFTVAGASVDYGVGNTGVGDGALRSNTEGYRNTGVGRDALYSNTTGTFNTATGSGALQTNTTGYSNTATGADALFSNTTGFRNTATGADALFSNTTGSTNTASGADALTANTTGYQNVAFGANALDSNTVGARNVAVGFQAGANATTGSDNVFISNPGVAGDAAKIRIGTQGTQNATFVAGIRGTTTANADAVAVVIDSAGQLGTVSSSRTVKQDVREIGDLADRLLALRPVAFRYRQHVARDAEAPLQFGLIAEEVAEVFPELVVRDEEGRPVTVKYHLLSALLLEELQRADAELAEQGAALGSLRDRLEAVESSGVADLLRRGRATCELR